MRATDLTELLKVVEEVRREKHPSLPKDLIRRIVMLEDEHGDDDVAALQAIRTLITEQGPTSPEGAPE